MSCWVELSRFDHLVSVELAQAGLGLGLLLVFVVACIEYFQWREGVQKPISTDSQLTAIYHYYLIFVVLQHNLMSSCIWVYNQYYRKTTVSADKLLKLLPSITRRPFKVNDYCCNQKRIYDFLSVITCHLSSISQNFPDIALLVKLIH